MYQFSGKLKLASIILMVVGLLGVGYGFWSAPKTVEEAKEMMASHDEHETLDSSKGEAKDIHAEENDDVNESNLKTASNNADANNDAEEHAEHMFHQLQNKPWAAVYVALFYFLGIALLVLVFYAIQRVAQAGWSIVLFRVMEAITANLLPASILMAIFLVLSALHYNHIFVWMAEGTFDPSSEKYDALVAGKAWWLNIPSWLIRGLAYLLIWNAYQIFIRRNSLKEDENRDKKTYKRSYNASVIFLLLFMFTESMASWDWIMSIDPHWFSSLFGWYVLSTLLVSALTVIAFITIYLRSKGFLPAVNDSHIHDLAKYMFGFSIFWAYLWFSQYMLIWYSNIPEETTYFVLRLNEYKLPFLLMVVMNFVFPVLLLINSEYKSLPWFILIGGVVILAGHYIDLYIMIMPGTVGEYWFFGIPELSALLFFLGLFIFMTFTAFAKANPVNIGNPFLKESEHFHYYNIEHRGEEKNHH
jgi:hypothetical protein